MAQPKGYAAFILFPTPKDDTSGLSPNMRIPAGVRSILGGDIDKYKVKGIFLHHVDRPMSLQEPKARLDKSSGDTLYIIYPTAS